MGVWVLYILCKAKVDAGGHYVKVNILVGVNSLCNNQMNRTLMGGIFVNKTTKMHYGWWIVVACCAITSCSGIIGTCGGNFYRPVAEELGVGIGKLTIYMTIMSLTMATLFPTAVKLLNKNLKPVLLLGGFLQYIAFGLMSCFTSVYHFYVAGFFIGLGASITMYMAVPILINMWFIEKKGLAMGISLAFYGISGAIASILVGYIMPAVGWRLSYVILACIGLAIYVFAIVFLIKTPEQKNVKPYGYENCTEIVNNTTVQQKEEKNLSPAAKRAAFICMMVCAANFAMATVESTQVSAFSSGHFHLSVGAAATMVSCFSIGLVVGNFMFGILDDKFGHIPVFLFGIGLIIFAQILLLLGNGSIAMITVTITMAGFAFAAYSVLPPLMANAIFGEKEYSKYWAYVSAAGCYIAAFGSPLYGAIFDVTGSYSGVFCLVAVLTAISGITGVLALKLGTEKN